MDFLIESLSLGKVEFVFFIVKFQNSLGLLYAFGFNGGIGVSIFKSIFCRFPEVKSPPNGLVLARCSS